MLDTHETLFDTASTPCPRPARILGPQPATPREIAPPPPPHPVANSRAPAFERVLDSFATGCPGVPGLVCCGPKPQMERGQLGNLVLCTGRGHPPMRATGCPGHPVLRMGGGPPPQRATGLSRRQTKLLTQTLSCAWGDDTPLCVRRGAQGTRSCAGEGEPPRCLRRGFRIRLRQDFSSLFEDSTKPMHCFCQRSAAFFSSGIQEDLI